MGRFNLRGTWSHPIVRACALAALNFQALSFVGAFTCVMIILLARCQPLAAEALPSGPARHRPLAADTAQLPVAEGFGLAPWVPF